MKVKLKVKLVSYGIGYSVGDIIDVRDDIAVKMVRSGKAELLKKKAVRKKGKK